MYKISLFHLSMVHSFTLFFAMVHEIHHRCCVVFSHARQHRYVLRAAAFETHVGSVAPSLSRSLAFVSDTRDEGDKGEEGAKRRR